MSDCEPEDSLEIEASLFAAENEDLKAKIALKDEILASVAREGIQKDAEIEAKNKLITELANLVQQWEKHGNRISFPQEGREILQRAREAR